MELSGGIQAQGQPVLEELDPRRAPPRDLRDIFKVHGRTIVAPEHMAQISDSSSLGEPEWILRKSISEDLLQDLFQKFQGGDAIKDTSELEKFKSQIHATSVYESIIIPGLIIIPSFLPADVQWTLLSRLFLRDLSERLHTTNLNLHYDIQYPRTGSSFFAEALNSVIFTPKDPQVHPTLNMERVLTKKLRWITLGGQYDWTNKVYPEESPPAFPDDIANLLKGIFTDIEPQAAIVNLYSPGDTLSLHRDVSEEVNRGLVSISLGCDGVFIIALRDSDDSSDSRASRRHILRLHSGDAVYMSGHSRYAWHGVPKIIPRTSPKELDSWPGDSFPQWRDYGYMANKRVNLNVRQMRDLSQ